jgi:hypothetical protein
MFPPELAFILGFATAFALMFIYRRGISRGRAETKGAAQPAAEPARNEQYFEVDQLRQRLAVLERITIDPGHRTAREIDALRDATN